MKYRVVLKVGYTSAWFDFADAQTACNFAETALIHWINGEDDKKRNSVSLKIMNETETAEEDE